MEMKSEKAEDYTYSCNSCYKEYPMDQLFEGAGDDFYCQACVDRADARWDSIRKEVDEDGKRIDL